MVTGTNRAGHEELICTEFPHEFSGAAPCCRRGSTKLANLRTISHSNLKLPGVNGHQNEDKSPIVRMFSYTLSPVPPTSDDFTKSKAFRLVNRDSELYDTGSKNNMSGNLTTVKSRLQLWEQACVQISL